MNKTHIIAYGGSIVCPTVDENGKPQYSPEAINNLYQLINENPDDKFFFIIGGGALARSRQDNRKKEIQNFINGSYRGKNPRSQELDKDAVNYLLDREGIIATFDNARKVAESLSKKGLEKQIFEEVLTEPYGRLADGIKERVFFAGGHKPGASTDFVMMKYADNYNANIVHKISNYDIVRNIKATDFKKENMHKYRVLKTATFEKMIGLVGQPEDFQPGDSTPLDPSAAKLGSEIASRIEGFTLNIGLMDKLPSMVAGESFDGTIVKEKRR